MHVRPLGEAASRIVALCRKRACEVQRLLTRQRLAGAGDSWTWHVRASLRSVLFKCERTFVESA